MAHITLTSEQALQVVGVPGEVEVRDPEGRLVGFLSWSDERTLLERAKRNRTAGGRRLPAHVVQSLMQRWTEAVERGDLDRKAALELFQRLKAEALE